MAQIIPGRSTPICDCASSGVPQGSHLGPTLSLMLINSLLTRLGGIGFEMYADDLKIFGTDPLMLQTALNKLED